MTCSALALHNHNIINETYAANSKLTEKDWQTQIVIADNLKSLSRKYDLTMI